MAGNATEKKDERRKYRRVSDAIALHIQLVDEAANQQSFEMAELADYPTHVVSLSPNGLKCFHSEPFNDGDELQLSFRLFPSQQQINTRAVVVNSGEDTSSTKNDRFFAGLSFVKFNSELRQALLEHIDQVARSSFGGSVKLVN